MNCRNYRKLLFFLSVIFQITVLSVPYYFDSTFGPNANGVVLESSGIIFNSLGIQSSGQIIAGGYILTNQIGNIFISRYNSNGSLDLSFGPPTSPGSITTSFAPASAVANDIAIQSDQKIIAVGPNGISSSSQFLVLRYLSNGSQLDNAFNDSVHTNPSGIVTINYGSYPVANGVAVQSNSQIVVAGTTSLNGFNAIMLARLNADGSIDNTFGSSGNGIVTTSVGDYCTGQGIAIQDDGQIVVVGFCSVNGVGQFIIIRYNANGSLDTTFNPSGLISGIPGIVLTPIGINAMANSVAIQGSGSGRQIVVAGFAYVSGSANIAVVRYDENGSLDINFNPPGNPNPAGIVTTQVGQFASANDIMIQSNNIVVGGIAKINRTNQALIARYLGTGVNAGMLDSTFGTYGIVTSPIGNNSSIQAVALSAVGNIQTVGTSDGVGFLAQSRSINTDFITIINPANSSTITSSPITVNGISTRANAQVQVVLNSDSADMLSVQTDNFGNWNAGNIGPVLNGANAITAGLFDPTSIASVSNNFTGSISTDSIAITTPANNSIATSSTVSISGTSSKAGATVQLLLDGVSIGSATTNSAGDWSVPVTISSSVPLISGKHTLTANLSAGTSPTTSNTFIYVAGPKVVQGTVSVTNTGPFPTPTFNGIGFNALQPSSTVLQINFTPNFSVAPTVIATGFRASGSSTVTVSAVTTTNAQISFNIGTTTIHFAAFSYL